MKTLLGCCLLLPTLLCAQSDLRIDTTFADQGIFLRSAEPGNDQMVSTSRTVGTQHNQKIIVGGYSDVIGGDGWNFTVMRLHPDGQQDLSFGTNGVARVRIWEESQVNAMLIQADDKIVLGGNAWGWENNKYSAHMALARFTADGHLDATFGTNGTLQLKVGETFDELNELLLLPDGRMVLVGAANTGWNDTGWGIVRLLPDGTPDTTFAGDGISLLNMGRREIDKAFCGQLLPDSSLLIGGYREDAATIIRLLPTGEQDTTWGVQGFAELPAYVGVSDINLDTQGRILCALINKDANQMITVRLQSDGTLDHSFNFSGYTVLSTEYVSGWNSPYDQVEVLPSGHILNIGALLQGRDPDMNLSFWVLDDQGGHDQDFGDKGWLKLDLCEYGMQNFQAHVLPDSALLVTGLCQMDPRSQFMVVKMTYRLAGPTAVPASSSPLSIMANPSTGPLSVNIPNDMVGELITISDLSGRKILNQTAVAGENLLELSGEGVFLIRIRDQKRKIVVLK